MSHDELLTRAVEKMVPKDLAEKKLKSGKPLRIYFGIDPTGSKLHLGHSVPLRKLRAFQDAGHEVIFLVGSFTAMIGDPSGRDQMREPLTIDQVRDNFKTYESQAKKILDFAKVTVRTNDEWLSKMSFGDVLKLASDFTVQQMLERDMFQKRMKDAKPIALNEFFYPLMQGYDSVMLDVDCEIGGNDQLFNMLCGRTLQQLHGKREKFVLTTKLLEGTDGRKMSKTYDNCVYLEDAPADMFGKIMSIKDDLILTYFECCTDVTAKEIETIGKELKKGANPRDSKVCLAKEIVTLYHSAKDADAAQAAFASMFAKHETPEDIPEVKVKAGTPILDLIVSEKLAASKSEARRLIEQGGVKLNDEAVTDIQAKAGKGVLKVGKRKFLKII